MKNGDPKRRLDCTTTDLSFAKTPHEAILVHVTCYAVSLYVIDSTCALDFGEAQLFPRSRSPSRRAGHWLVVHQAVHCRFSRCRGPLRRPAVKKPATFPYAKASRCFSTNCSTVIGGRPPIVETRAFMPAKIPL